MGRQQGERAQGLGPDERHCDDSDNNISIINAIINNNYRRVLNYD